ncbi:MAG: hypothetical protein GY948_21550 [Alphaproteobacteria bacterium]|nr:hypothetical protein [Alphaproteobacteria bacterium]
MLVVNRSIVTLPFALITVNHHLAPPHLDEWLTAKSFAFPANVEAF